MKRVVITLFILGMILTLGCSKVEKVEFYNEKNASELENNNARDNYVIEKESKSIDDNEEEIKVSIKSNKRNFFNEGVKLTPVIDGEIDKEVQYNWIIESKNYIDGEFYNSETNLEGFVGNKGPLREIINDGESIEFALYAEVSYIDGAYSENKVILQIEEKDTGNILGRDELIIENRQGMYFVNTSEDEWLKNEVLKSEKAKIYAEIFDIIWTIDTGLNPDGQYINVDTKSFENFTEEEKRQLFEYLSKKYNKTILDKTFDELEAEGYIENMGFKDGVMFKANKYLKNNENEASFEGTKWVSGDGAIGFIAEAEKVNDRWIIKKCQMTWIS